MFLHNLTTGAFPCKTCGMENSTYIARVNLVMLLNLTSHGICDHASLQKPAMFAAGSNLEKQTFKNFKAFAHGRLLCLAELDLATNLLNKIQFTFRVVPSLLDFRPFLLKVCINFSPALQGGGWKERRVGKTPLGEDMRS